MLYRYNASIFPHLSKGYISFRYKIIDVNKKHKKIFKTRRLFSITSCTSPDFLCKRFKNSFRKKSRYPKTQHQCKSYPLGFVTCATHRIQRNKRQNKILQIQLNKKRPHHKERSFLCMIKTLAYQLSAISSSS